MSNQRTPPIPADLLDYLEAVFPDRCPRPTATDQEVRVLMGEQNVVKHLRAKFSQQNKTILNT